jgi:hypothetical protein
VDVVCRVGRNILQGGRNPTYKECDLIVADPSPAKVFHAPLGDRPGIDGPEGIFITNWVIHPGDSWSEAREPTAEL